MRKASLTLVGEFKLDFVEGLVPLPFKLEKRLVILLKRLVVEADSKLSLLKVWGEGYFNFGFKG